MKIFIKKIDGVTLPKRATEVSAGYDIVATSEPKIVGELFEENSWKQISYIEYETNLFIAPYVNDIHTLIHPRSSISKYNLVLANSIGLVDNDYRGMVICRFKYMWQPMDMWWGEFDGQKTTFGKPNMEKVYKKGDTIAQLVFEPTITADFEFVDDLNQTNRGIGGFGSTDVIKETTKQNSDSRTIEDLIKQKENFFQPGQRYSEIIKERDDKLFK